MQILGEFHDRLDDTWNKKGFRRQIWSLEPQITQADANALLRIGIIQAIDNAKAYCRNFERLGASQQMAMTQLVYQMGVNLEEFSTFLNLINRGGESPANGPAAIAKADAAYWRERADEAWCRASGRGSIAQARQRLSSAMLDPAGYSGQSVRGRAQHRGQVLHPTRTRRAHGTTTLRKASYTTRHHGSAAHKRDGADTWKRLDAPTKRSYAARRTCCPTPSPDRRLLSGIRSIQQVP